MKQYKSLSPEELKTAIRDGKELALIDVREQGIFFHGHLFFACCIPLGRLELLVGNLVPRLATRIVLCDGGEDESSLATQALARLTELGYNDCALLKGGIAAWRDAGFELFSGINVPSKAFGEFVEINYATPHISAQQLHAKQQAGEQLVILDSRPMDEFQRMSIPGGIDCPGAELVYRVNDQVSDDITPIVVNCAGRTRSIIGAQSLINAGIPNPVMALKDGTMGWTLAGYDVAKGQTVHAGEPGPAGLAAAKQNAAHVAQRFGVAKIDQDILQQWLAEAEQQTLYVLDVRTPQEYLAGHLPYARNAPGGQLVQASDEYMVTRHAKVVLVDNDEIRAIMTASWLIQLGWQETYVLQGGLHERDLVSGKYEPTVLGLKKANTIAVAELKNLIQADNENNLAILDLATSLQYRRGHIPGSYWGIRGRLDLALARLPAHKQLILTAPETALAHLAAKDIERFGHPADLLVLDGGTDAWQQLGNALETEPEYLTSEPNDVWYKPYDNKTSIQQSMRDYLTWEVNLVAQIERDGNAQFRVFD